MEICGLDVVMIVMNWKKSLNFLGNELDLAAIIRNEETFFQYIKKKKSRFPLRI